MSKIVIDARRIRESTGRYARGLLNALEELDTEDEFHVIIHEKDQGSWSPKSENFFMHVVPYDSYTFGEQLGFAKFLQKLRPDLVHFLMPQQPLLYFGKRITTIHDLTLVRFKNVDKNRIVYAVEQTIFKFLLLNVARRSKKILTPSKFVKADIINYAHIPSERVIVTYESADVIGESEPIANPSINGKKFLLYVGNAFPHKNLKRLTQAFALFRGKHPEYHLVLVGKKEFFYNQLEEHIQNTNMKHIHVLGFVSDNELSWLYKHSTAYVFPSLSEGFGLPGLETMRYNKPLISSDATCLPEIYGDAAMYFDPEDEVAMASAMDKVIRSKERQQELIRAGQIRLKKYSWEKMAKETLKQYKEVLEK